METDKRENLMPTSRCVCHHQTKECDHHHCRFDWRHLLVYVGSNDSELSWCLVCLQVESESDKVMASAAFYTVLNETGNLQLEKQDKISPHQKCYTTTETPLIFPQ